MVVWILNKNEELILPQISNGTVKLCFYMIWRFKESAIFWNTL